MKTPVVWKIQNTDVLPLLYTSLCSSEGRSMRSCTLPIVIFKWQFESRRGMMLWITVRDLCQRIACKNGIIRISFKESFILEFLTWSRQILERGQTIFPVLWRNNTHTNPSLLVLGWNALKKRNQRGALCSRYYDHTCYSEYVGGCASARRGGQVQKMLSSAFGLLWSAFSFARIHAFY